MKGAVASIVRHAHPGRLLEGEEATAFLTQDGILHGRFSMAIGMLTGFPASGAAAVADLARDLRHRKPALAHGVALPELATAIASEILDRFGAARAPTADAAAWSAIETALDSWFAASAIPRRHYVPSAIIADRAAPFDIGSISFVHAADLASHERGLQQDAMAEVTVGPLLQALRERAASWIAIVEVDGCHPSRSSELADLAVDVAIGALQLVIPANYARPMARVTARTAPPWRGNLHVAAGQVHSSIQNMEAGHGLSAAAFDQMVAGAKPLLDAAGKSVDVFLTRQGSLTNLRQAWCDGLYWFHEALAESLATVATTKFETAIEALLRAESSPKSEARMRDAVKVLTGLGPKDLLPGSSTLTVEKFAKELVRARSKAHIFRGGSAAVSTSPIITTIRQRLRDAQYDDLPTPFRIAGVEFQFTGAMRGRHGRALDLVLLVDTTAGDFGDSDGARVRHRVQAMSRALDVTGSRYVLTVVLAGAALPSDMESLAETARVLHVDTLPLGADGTPDLRRLEDSIRVLLPLSIPQVSTDEQDGTAKEQLEKALANTVDSGTIDAIMAAAEHGEDAVTAAIAGLIDAALQDLEEEEKA